MDWNLELLMVGRAMFAALLGALIGWEREQHGREAGIRTYTAVSLGACVFGLPSSHVSTGSDPTRIAAGVVTGGWFFRCRRDPPRARADRGSDHRRHHLGVDKRR